jgi:hypothetical protein
MKEKIKSLLAEKREQARALNLEWSKVWGYSASSTHSEKMDKLETEINLLENLLK